MEKLAPDLLGELDREITQWGQQGFEDIGTIVFEDKTVQEFPRILDENDIITRVVKTMDVRGADLFVTTTGGEILHYRMGVTRL